MFYMYLSLFFILNPSVTTILSHLQTLLLIYVLSPDSPLIPQEFSQTSIYQQLCLVLGFDEFAISYNLLSREPHCRSAQLAL